MMRRSEHPGLPMLAAQGWRPGRVSTGWTVALVAAGPVMAGLTALAFSLAERGEVDADVVRAVLLADLVYLLALGALIILAIARMIAANRARSAGARLHMRLSGLFTVVALAPTVLVAVFATLTVNFGMEAWFSAQVRSVVANALTTAEAYEEEHRGNIRGDSLAMANDLNRALAENIDQGALGELVRQQALIRELPESYVLDGQGEIVARGEFSYLFTLERPDPAQFAAARAGEVVVIEDLANNEMRALVYLTASLDLFLYVTRRIDGEVLSLLDDTRETVALYERLERERAGMLFEFALLYLGFALLVIMAAVWLGLRFAEQLARPIGRLAGAAERVGAGDFDMRVRETAGEDEVAVLSRAFNRMTAQVKRQRDALIAANDETESRRRFIEAVLSGVSAGVIGLDAGGRIELANAAAATMLRVHPADAQGRPLAEVAPDLARVLERARQSAAGFAQDEVHLGAEGARRELLARVTPKGADAAEGAVLTLDDLTELAQAQRMAAWGDVARRVAHEIKNPLTPIQLSADRLKKKKFANLTPEERAALDQYADVISRQAADIRRMVDAFSKLARMPDPERGDEDLARIVRDAILLQQSADAGVGFALDAPATLPLRCDRGMISQALTNLLKNAVEAVSERAGQGGPPGEVRVSLRLEADRAVVEIADNGVGLPEKDRDRLAEPYVTTRARGTGLGLAIVKKIVEQHGGALSLEDAPPFAEGARPGALARIELPVTSEAERDTQRGA
jgi:two-component system nitrogen regulation sensor histidine kinase NtrY